MVFPNEYCKQCGEQYIDRNYANYEWCKQCQINNFINNFTNWTSENEKIDALIQEMQLEQLEINSYNEMIFEWIPYNQFNDIEEIGEKSFKNMYLAIWKDGPLNYIKGKNKYTRNQQNTKVILKKYNFIDESLNEV
jgi:hypothetical protein